MIRHHQSVFLTIICIQSCFEGTLNGSTLQLNAPKIDELQSMSPFTDDNSVKI